MEGGGELGGGVGVCWPGAVRALAASAFLRPNQALPFPAPPYSPFYQGTPGTQADHPAHEEGLEPGWASSTRSEEGGESCSQGSSASKRPWGHVPHGPSPSLWSGHPVVSLPGSAKVIHRSLISNTSVCISEK